MVGCICVWVLFNCGGCLQLLLFAIECCLMCSLVEVFVVGYGLIMFWFLLLCLGFCWCWFLLIVLVTWFLLFCIRCWLGLLILMVFVWLIGGDYEGFCLSVGLFVVVCWCLCFSMLILVGRFAC